jgi:hypothetical protein
MDDDFRQLRRGHLGVLDEAAGRIGEEFLAEPVIFPAALDELGFKIMTAQL